MTVVVSIGSILLFIVK